MSKLKEEQLQRLKRIQDVDDDDMKLDIATRHKASSVRAVVDEPKESASDQKKDTKNLIVGMILVVVVFVAFLLWLILVPDKRGMTIDEMHEANLAGKLPTEQGYVYNGFSFIKYSEVWYSRLKKNNTVYDVSFNHDPLSVEDIPVRGRLNREFSEGEKIYVTFDPAGRDLQYVGVANYGISRSLAWAFGYYMTAACTKNITKACEKAGVVQCGDDGKSIIYIKEADETAVVLDDTCVTVQGRGPEIVRAKDRLLLRWYKIMDS
jgi:hypothetical protein